jgi:hypothetical protein
MAITFDIVLVLLQRFLSPWQAGGTGRDDSEGRGGIRDLFRRTAAT